MTTATAATGVAVFRAGFEAFARGDMAAFGVVGNPPAVTAFWA